jgi:protein-tyrosine-phosphatase
MTEAPARVLFVSTGGACRALFAQALLRQVGGSAFEVWSAGTDPAPVDPLTLDCLARAGVDAAGLEPRPLAELVGSPFEYVITLCDDARLVCPVFPGADQSMHWGYPSPARLADAAERRAEMERVLVLLGERIRQFVLIAGRSQPTAVAG